MMVFDERLPFVIAELGRRPRRPDDIGEHDRGEDAVEFGLLVLQLGDESLDLVNEIILI
jgi:hypothetical protein